MILYDSPFSPFARKIRLALSLKKLETEFVDSLDHDQAETLRSVNGRAEVPALIDNGLVVVNSADIVAYLEHQYPQHPVLPENPADRVKARKWERLADSFIDPIMVDISYWKWAEREDEMPTGMLAAARTDLSRVYDQLEKELGNNAYICGELSIADIALFPHLIGAAALDVPLCPSNHKNTISWLHRLKSQKCFSADIDRARQFLLKVYNANIERKKIFWRGERIEWLLARGFHHWFFNEIEEGRVLWPPQSPL